jgi:hypothetical protein
VGGGPNASLGINESSFPLMTVTTEQMMWSVDQELKTCNVDTI